MKSLLVDALRAANDNDDGLQLEETVAPGIPARLPEEQVVAAEIGEEIELLETAAEAAETQPADSAAANSDAHFPDAAPVEEIARQGIPISTSPGGTTVFERVATWMPVVCMLLVACSAAAFSGWNSLTGLSQNAELGALLGQAHSDPESGVITAGDRASRFQFIDSARVAAPSARSAVAITSNASSASTVEGSIVVIPQARAARAVAGLTDVDDASFSSLAAVYQAFVSGQIEQSALDRLLERAAMAGGEATELEIKLLLQRYPGSASLHNALGTMYANSGRWPEARVVFERAGELAKSASESSPR